MAKKRKPIPVSFVPARRPAYSIRYGGRGIMTKLEPWTGPKTWMIGERFVITRLERSPTGSGHGSFQIEERIKNRLGWATIVRGFSCSIPDESMCKRVVRESSYSSLQGERNDR